MDPITTPLGPELVRGALELTPTADGVQPHRLPARARAQCTDAQLAMAESYPAGVRVAFRTPARSVELRTLRTRVGFRGMPLRPDGVYDLLVDGALVAHGTTDGGKLLMIDPATGTPELEQGPVGAVRFDGLPDGDKNVEIWLPHNEITELVELVTDAPVEPSPRHGRTWLHHGSSISQGSNAASAATTWTSLTARAAKMDLLNLGFSGGALIDPFTARAMRDTPADVVSVKLGINVVNADLMRQRAFGPAVHGFLDTVRDGHPDTPLLLVSPLYCPIHEDTPGPGAMDVVDGAVRFSATGEPGQGRLTLNVIRDELAAVAEQRATEDPNLHYLDGRELYGEQDFAELPLPDALHPDGAAHQRIADRFTEYAFGDEGPFAATG